MRPPPRPPVGPVGAPQRNPRALHCAQTAKPRNSKAFSGDCQGSDPQWGGPACSHCPGRRSNWCFSRLTLALAHVHVCTVLGGERGTPCHSGGTSSCPRSPQKCSSVHLPLQCPSEVCLRGLDCHMTKWQLSQTSLSLKSPLVKPFLRQKLYRPSRHRQQEPQMTCGHSGGKL